MIVLRGLVTIDGYCSECFNVCFIVHAFIPFYSTVEEEIDSDGFDKDGFDLSGPKSGFVPLVRPSALSILNLDCFKGIRV